MKGNHKPTEKTKSSNDEEDCKISKETQGNQEVTLNTVWTGPGEPPRTNEFSMNEEELKSPRIQGNRQHMGESPKKVVTKKLGRAIQVDGVNYLVTMEPPGPQRLRTGCRSAPPIDARERMLSISKDLHGSTAKDTEQHPSSNTNTIDLQKLSSDLTEEQLGEWFGQRSHKSKLVNVNHFGPEFMIEPTNIEALDHAALRLRHLLVTLTGGGNVSKGVLKQNLEYTVSVLESGFLRSRKITPADISLFTHRHFVPHKLTIGPNVIKATPDNEILEHFSDKAPAAQEIKSWLVETFTGKRVGAEKKQQEPARQRFRGVVKAVQAGMLFDRLFRRPLSQIPDDTLPPDVEAILKNIDKWTFDVFALDQASTGNALRYVCYQLLTKYDLLRKFKIAPTVLLKYCNRVQRAYKRHNNRYHNPTHAADVAQTMNCFLVYSGFANWLSDIEIFAMIMAAVVHDLEHTGTTNNFHINTRSELAMLYNDKSVLENHHISLAFRLLHEEGCDILASFSRDDYQDCRSLMVEMVLATDMVRHFQQLTQMEELIQCPVEMERSKAMCLLIHASDINHPAKPWKLHHQWTERLMYEFFRQGDVERDLNLPISPLCDRQSARIAQSQIGFIDFVVKPTFLSVLTLLKQVNSEPVREAISSIHEERRKNKAASVASSLPNDILKFRFCDSAKNDEIMKNYKEIEKELERFKELCNTCISYNRKHWVKKDVIEAEKSLLGDNALGEAVNIEEDELPAIIRREMASCDVITSENVPAENNDSSQL